MPRSTFTVVGSLDLFPTLYPQDGPFFVANLDHIHEALGGTYPYDVWLATDAPAAGETIVDGVRDLGLVVVTAQRRPARPSPPSRRAPSGRGCLACCRSALSPPPC